MHFPRRSDTTERIESLHSGVDEARHRVPQAMSRAASQVQDRARRGIEAACDTGAQVRLQMARAGDRGVDYVRDRPVQSLLITAAVAATLAALLAWMARPHSPRA